MRTPLLVAVAMSLSACPTNWDQYDITCRTERGTTLRVTEGAEALATCDVFAEHELRTINAILRHTGSKETERLLWSLKTLNVIVKTAAANERDDGFLVWGWSDCNGSTMIIQREWPDEANWQKTSLAHEYVHVAQGCEAKQPKHPLPCDPWPEKDPEHVGWCTDGARDAVAEADGDGLWWKVQ